MPSTKVTLFIPCFNVGSRATELLQKLPRELDFHQILVIDNGSTDGTREVLKAFLRESSIPFRLILNDHNYMLGGSTIIAFDLAIKAGSDFLICMHGDGQADPNDLKKFFPLHKNVDFVFGSRMMEDSQIQDYSLVRKVGNYFFAILQQTILRQKIMDIGAFIAFNLQSVREIPFEQVKADMSYHPTLVLYLATKRRLRAREFAISWGKVETSHVNIWVYGWEHLKKILSMKLGWYRLTNQKLSEFTFWEEKNP